MRLCAESFLEKCKERNAALDSMQGVSTISVWKHIFVTLVVFFPWRLETNVFFPYTDDNVWWKTWVMDQCEISKKKLLIAISCWKRSMVRILSRAYVFKWGHQKWSHPGWSASVSTPPTVTKINEIICGDNRMSIRMIAETVNADKETSRKILYYELNMKSSVWNCSQKIDLDQKLVHQQICSDFFERLDEELELKENFIICDENWIFQYEVWHKSSQTTFRLQSVATLWRGRWVGRGATCF